MSLIADTLINHLPFKRRQTPSGWISFNAVCCNDQRNRGGVIKDGEAVSYHCFNCGFKASWQPGRNISVKVRKLLKLLNVDDNTISQLQFEALRHLDKETVKTQSSIPTFIPRSLPNGAEPIENFLSDPPNELIPVLEYIYSRNLTLDDYKFYWTPEEGFNNRLIIPYYYRGQIVGYTGRRIDKGEPKYLAEQQPGYVFNLDKQVNRNFVVLCEGPLDAISVDGIAIMGSDINEAQSLLIKQLYREIVVVPDRDKPGEKLVKSAVKYNWSVSFPDWDQGIKDINDAVKKYGKINTLMNIRKNSHKSEVKIKILMKDWFNHENN